MIALALAQAIVVALIALLLVRIARRRRAAHLLGAACVVQAVSMLWAMALTPARYEPYLYARGGLARTVQVLATSLGPAGVALGALVLAAVYVMSGPRRTAATAAAAILFVPARASALPDVLLLSASTFPVAPPLEGKRVPNAYPGIDHDRLADRFPDYEVRAVSAPRAARSVPFPLLFLPIIDTPLARVLAPAVERAAHAGDPALVAREALRVLALPHEKPLLVDVRFDATDPPYDVPAPFYAVATDRAYRGRFAYSAPAAEGLDARDSGQVDALRAGAAAAIEDAARELARHAPVAIFTADRGLTPFESVPFVVRGDDVTDWPQRLGVAVASPGHVVLARTAEAPPLGLPQYMVRDDRYELVYRPERSGVSYALYDLQTDPDASTDVSDRHPEIRAYLRGELWDRLREEDVFDQEGFAVPRPRLPFTVEWAVEAPDGITFTDAHATSDESVVELASLVALTKTRGPKDPAKRIVVGMPNPHAVEGPAPIPLAISVPGFPARAIGARVGTADVAATLRALLGLEPSSRSRGVSLVPLMRGEDVEERAIVTRTHEGVRAVFWGRHHLVDRRGRRSLYDLDADPLEQHDLATKDPGLAAELGARLIAAEAGVPMAWSQAALDPGPPPRMIHLRFAGAGAVHRISGTIEVAGKRTDIALMTSACEVIALDVKVEPADADVTWQLYLDDGPWPAKGVFLGCHGVATTSAFSGLTSDESRERATCDESPTLDARTDLGVFVTR